MPNSVKQKSLLGVLRLGVFDDLHVFIRVRQKLRLAHRAAEFDFLIDAVGLVNKLNRLAHVAAEFLSGNNAMVERIRRRFRGSGGISAVGTNVLRNGAKYRRKDNCRNPIQVFHIAFLMIKAVPVNVVNLLFVAMVQSPFLFPTYAVWAR